MRAPPSRLIYRWLQGIGLFISGMIVGSAVFMFIEQHNFKMIVELNATLQRQKDHLAEQLEDEKKYKNQQTMVKSVLVYVVPNAEGELPETIVENKIKTAVEADLKVIKGKPALLPELYAKLIDGKEYADIENKSYRVHLKYISIIYSEMYVWIEVRLIKN